MDQSQDGYLGISQIAMAREAVGMGLAMEAFGGKFFANDMKSGGFLMHPGKLSSNARGNIRGRDGEQKASPDNPKAALEGQAGLDNAHRIKVLEEGMKFISTTIPPEDAQFLGSREFQIAEIARIFDVPLILLQSHEKTTSWGSGIEQLMIGFIRQTVGPWVDAWEQELNWKLFTEEEKAQGYYVKFNMNAILRGDMKTRAEFYQKIFGVGGFSPNRILELEDEDPIGPEGDHHFVPGNFVTLDRATDPTYQPSGASAGGNDEDPEEREADERAERGQPMKYAHILMAAASEYWAMQPEKMMAIIELLATQADGTKFSTEEIQARIAPQTAKAVARREGTVAVIPLRGVISNRMNMMGNISGGGGTSAEQFAQQLKQARDDNDVKAVIIDTDTPGGVTSGVDEAAEVVASFRGIKPIVAQVNSTAASAGYWIVSGADEIVMTPSGWVGSIGVYTVHDNIAAELEKRGVTKTLISAGPFKTEANPFGPLSEEALAYRQQQVDTLYGMFVDRVAKGRGVASSAVRDGFGQGRMVLAADAVTQGMADRIGTMEDTLARFGVAPAATERARARAPERMKRAASL